MKRSRFAWLGAVATLMFAATLVGAQEPIDPPHGLIGWWTGDVSALDTVGKNDGTMGPNPGNPDGSATTAAGKVGAAFRFNGTSDRFFILATPAMRTGRKAGFLTALPTRFSFECWFKSDNLDKPDAVTSEKNQALIQYGHTYADGRSALLYVKGGLLAFVIRGVGTGYDDLFGSTTLASNTWYHVAVTYDGTIARIYLNGALEASAATTIVMDEDTSVSLQVGRYTNVKNGNNFYYFDGLIDEVVLYDRALPISEIQATHNAGAAGMRKWPDLSLVFGTRQDYDTDAGGFEVETVDLNGDGYLDLAGGGVLSNFVWWRLNAGDGSFGAISTIVTATGPGGVRSSDLNGDGRPDLAVTHGASATLAVLLNDGQGGFVRQLLATGTTPIAVTAADLNGDGKIDLTVANNASDSLSIYLNSGSGSFVASGTVSTGDKPSDVRAVDMDGDGDRDLVVIEEHENAVEVLLNDGLGRFLMRSKFRFGHNPIQTAIGDLDGDGCPDLAISSVFDDLIYVFKNNGASGGTWNGFTQVQRFTAPRPYSLVLLDLDGDRDLDLAADSISPDVTVGKQIRFFVNNGSAGFATHRTNLWVPRELYGPRRMRAGDLNNDGKPDLVGGLYEDAVLSDRHAFVFLNATEWPDHTPPTAVAGSDQAISVGQTVYLDASASFDDTTAAASLIYSWSFVSKPAGSTTAFSGAGTASPTFRADLPGEYRLELVVRDEANLESAPDEVVISSLNIAPTADAGADRVVIVNQLVVLDGTGSADANGHSLSYQWVLTTAPSGSLAALAGATTASPTIRPDLPGDYVVTLVVSDGYDDSTPDDVTLTAISGVDYAEGRLRDAAAYITGLPAAAFDAPGHRNYFTNRIAKIIRFLQKGDTVQARKHLIDVIARTDGWVLRQAADPKGKKQVFAADFLMGAVDQVKVYGLLADALTKLN